MSECYTNSAPVSETLFYLILAKQTFREFTNISVKIAEI